MNESHESTFKRYQDDTVLLQSERYAFWTIPTVFTRENTDGSRITLQRDYQSKGAMLVNSLASKWAMSMFPIGTSFFALQDTPEMAEVGAKLSVTADSVNSWLRGLELEANKRLFLRDGYSKLFHLMKLLIVTGNALLYRNSADGRFSVFSVRDYVVKRTGSGKVMCIVLRERIARQEVPAGILDASDAADPYSDVQLFTKIARETREAGDVFVVTQEINNKTIGNAAIYPEMLCPYIPVVWNLASGEHYGRGHVEDYAGDFAKMSELNQALTLYEVESLRFVNMVPPSSGSDIDELNAAETGEYVAGNANDIGAYEGGEFQKIQAISADLASVFSDLARAFMYTGNVRDAERVTAEEIRMLAREVESTFGGNYSAVVESIHYPLAHVLLEEVDPQLGFAVRTGVLTLSMKVGTAALNRANALQALSMAVNDMNLILPVLSQATKRTNPDSVIDLILNAHGVDPSTLFYTEDQLKKKAEAEQAAAAAPASGIAADAANTALLSDQLGRT